MLRLPLRHKTRHASKKQLYFVSAWFYLLEIYYHNQYGKLLMGIIKNNKFSKQPD